MCEENLTSVCEDRSKPKGVSLTIEENKIMNILLPPNTIPEFHYFQRFRWDWHLVFYCHNENDPFVNKRESAFTLRENLTRDFMIRLQRRLGLRAKEIVFFASTEFGITQRGHLHVLLSLDRLRSKLAFTKISNSNLIMNSAVDEAREEMFQRRLKINCELISPCEEGQTDILSYVCKNEFGHEYKHCFYSRFLLNE